MALRSLPDWKFVSSSVVFLYDFEDVSRCDLKFIDFGRARRTGKEEFDDETCEGVENMIRFLMEIGERAKEFESVEAPPCDAEGVIPEKKLAKFSKNSEKVEKLEKSDKD